MSDQWLGAGCAGQLFRPDLDLSAALCPLPVFKSWSSYRYQIGTHTRGYPSQVNMFRRTLLQRLEFENSNRGRVLCLRMFCAAKRREALQITLIIDIKREIRRCQIEGGAVLDSCFVQIRTHQQHFCPLPDFRAGALLSTTRVPAR